MKKDTFTIWNKPDCGPLVVQERDETQQHCIWLSESEAVARASQLKGYFPHMDFLVRKEDSAGYASISFDTSKQKAKP